MKSKAEQLRETAHTLRYRSSQGSYSRAARKSEQVRWLERMAARLERRDRKPTEPFDFPF